MGKSLEEQGAQVTGIDLAPGLVALAREEAVNRGARLISCRPVS